ncbi:hypothetical protein D3C73_1359180 [compost metagenome]
MASRIAINPVDSRPTRFIQHMLQQPASIALALLLCPGSKFAELCFFSIDEQGDCGYQPVPVEQPVMHAISVIVKLHIIKFPLRPHDFMPQLPDGFLMYFLDLHIINSTADLSASYPIFASRSRSR